MDASATPGRPRPEGDGPGPDGPEVDPEASCGDPADPGSRPSDPATWPAWTDRRVEPAGEEGYWVTAADVVRPDWRARGVATLAELAGDPDYLALKEELGEPLAPAERAALAAARREGGGA